MRYPQEQKTRTRARLVRAAGALAKQRGFANTGMDALAAAAGVTTGAFYGQFSSKAEFLRAIIDHELGHVIQLFEGGGAPPAEAKALSKGEAKAPSHGEAKAPVRSLDAQAVAHTTALQATLAFYLSDHHVALPERGCAIPALASEIARADVATRQRFEDHMQTLVQVFARETGSVDVAWALVAQAVGGVMLARAMATSRAREAVLAGVRTQMAAALGAV
jgi:TetR/AcrR family transcriptional regulator, transcriptional repressor for nem operon